jgi:light-regulated signal transduction histidine kinase (bacteriophytochrome)
MNHHFPASDIPNQARAFYIRNLIRVIPDAEYVPQPIRSVSESLRELDLSDSTLRSVSLVHIQYLKSMGGGFCFGFHCQGRGALGSGRLPSSRA